MPQACANGIFANRAISSVPMIAARMDATYTAFQICWKAGSASGARWLSYNLVRVRDYDVSHREERRETGNDLCADVRAHARKF